jgi:hypothetical protein
MVGAYNNEEIWIGTRPSRLAIAQAQAVVNRLAWKHTTTASTEAGSWYRQRGSCKSSDCPNIYFGGCIII